ncbi:MAG: hypothetical protein P0116_14920 [Candidatus Nitrosocosmicus sp.]|nr:hypothetical protein [Candidatus Nitrosocosmicus sp.]
MDVGNNLREKTNRNDILSLLAINKIKEVRTLYETKGNTAYVFKSLKHPYEVEMQNVIDRKSL